MDIIDLLSKISLFSNLSHDALYRLSELVQNRYFEPQEIIVEENKVASGCWIIVKGHVQVLKGPNLLYHLGGGEILDEMAIFNDLIVETSVQALQPTHCLLIERWDFKAQMQAYPEIALQLLPVLTKRLQSKTAQNTSQTGK